MAAKQKATKVCGQCGKQRRRDKFKAHNKTKDGLRNTCILCTEGQEEDPKPAKRTKRAKADDAKLNGILRGNLGTLESSRLMPTVNALVAAMRRSGIKEVYINLHTDTIDIPQPERYALPKGDS